MKKIRILRFILVIGIIMFVAGCGSRIDISDSNEKSDMGDIALQEDDELKQEITEFESEEPGKANSKIIKIYYIDDSTGELSSESAEIKDENDIWAKLQEKGMLTNECKILSFAYNEKNMSIDLDFNVAVGDWIRSFGTTGETEIIGCLINTYLDAYECEGIRLTEEGQVFETGHGAEFDGYTGKIEL